MPAMDDAPYSLQFCLLQAALRACGLPPVASADVQGIAAKIALATRRFRVREQLTSVKRAKNEVKRARAEDKRAREIRLHAVKLGRLLSKQDGPLAASLESYFDRLPPPRDDDNKRALFFSFSKRRRMAASRSLLFKPSASPSFSKRAGA
jgi:hypothetical protein